MSCSSLPECNYNKPNSCNMYKTIPKNNTLVPTQRINNSIMVRDVDIENHKYKINAQASSSTIASINSWRWRISGGDKIELPRDQGNCGCCWSFALCSVLGDRYALTYNIPSPYPSPLWLMTKTYCLFSSNCTNFCFQGGDPFTASVNILEKEGVKSEECWPFEILNSRHNIGFNNLPNDCCFNCCSSMIQNRADVMFTVVPGSTDNIVVLDSSNNVDIDLTINQIKTEIYNNGPVLAVIKVYSDFITYWNTAAPYSSIYMYDGMSSNNLIGGHAVTITGWGSEPIYKSPTETQIIHYWEVRNSWGKYEGDQGYCRIAMSSDWSNNKNIGIDVPTVSIDSSKLTLSWGVISIKPGLLPDAYVPEVITTPVPTNSQLSNNYVFTNLFSPLDKIIIGAVFIILIIIILI